MAHAQHDSGWHPRRRERRPSSALDARLTGLPAPTKIGAVELSECGRWLAYYHIVCMVIGMKTTLNIDNTVMKRLREEAARRQTTMSALVEAGLRHVLANLDAERGRLGAAAASPVLA